MKDSCPTEGSRCAAKCFKIALLAVAGIAALGGVVMLLWNWLLPELFPGARPIGYWQALGVLLLSKILFGGWRGGCHGRWKARRERWESMTPEERAQLKGRLHGRWGAWCAPRAAGDDAAKDAPRT